MPCINFQIDPAIGPIVNIGIAPAASLNTTTPAQMGKAPAGVQWIKAIADTGCTHTSIYSGIASALSLPILSKAMVNSTTHAVAANVYLCDLFIRISLGTSSFDYRFPDRLITELLRQDTRFDALLGMDILSMGNFVINGPIKLATFCW